MIFNIQNLTVRYGRFEAVSDLNLSLQEGQCLALLGINGAGKTSTIKALLGMNPAYRGEVQLMGQAPGSAASFRHVGFAPEEAEPPEFLNALEYLTFIVRFRKASASEVQSEVQRALEFFELDPKKKIKAYSKGMRRRILLAGAFIGAPRFLILDEPLSGLDPLFIQKLRKAIELHLQGGGSVLFSSHILSEVEKTCTEVSVVDGGRLLYHQSLSATLSEHGSVENAFSQLILEGKHA